MNQVTAVLTGDQGQMIGALGELFEKTYAQHFSTIFKVVGISKLGRASCRGVSGTTSVAGFWDAAKGCLGLFPAHVKRVVTLVCDAEDRQAVIRLERCCRHVRLNGTTVSIDSATQNSSPVSPASLEDLIEVISDRVVAKQEAASRPTYEDLEKEVAALRAAAAKKAAATATAADDAARRAATGETVHA